MTMTISALGEHVGLTADTLRYYQKIGLIPPPERSPSGYRLFGEASLERLRFIKTAQNLGLRLKDIRVLLEVMDKGLCPCGHAETQLKTRMAEVDEEIARLTSLRAAMARTLERSADCTDPGCWPCDQIPSDLKEVNADG